MLEYILKIKDSFRIRKAVQHANHM